MENLEQLWSESAKQHMAQVTKDFLQRALKDDSTLENLASLLNYKEIKPFLASLRVRDIFDAAHPSTATSTIKVSDAKEVGEGKERRTRMTEARKNELVHLFLNAFGGTSLNSKLSKGDILALVKDPSDQEDLKSSWLPITQQLDKDSFVKKEGEKVNMRYSLTAKGKKELGEE